MSGRAMVVGEALNLFYPIRNPQAAEAAVTITRLRPPLRAPIARTYVVAPLSRANICVDEEGLELSATDVSAVLIASIPVIVERAMYSNAGGASWAAGANALATKLR